jgi:hypothetical protein
MSQRKGPTRIKLADFKAAKAEEGKIIIEADDGTEFVIPPAILWPDEVNVLAVQGRHVEAARLVLGEDVYDKFVAAGGNAQILGAVVREENEGTPLGE